MNPTFEEMWNYFNSAEGEDAALENVFASMQPYRVPYAVPTGIDARMARAYKNLHTWNVSEASNNMEMIYSKTICRKCLLHTKVCRTYGHDLKKFEANLHLAAKLSADEIHNRMKTHK